MTLSERLYYWAPRISSILFVLLLSLFSLDVFSEYSGNDALLPLFIHLVPSLILLIIAVIAWKYELIGAITYLGFAVFYVWDVGFTRPLSWYAAIALPAAIVGSLYLAGWLHKKRGNPLSEKGDTSQCCLPFDTTLWNEKTHQWKDKLFLQDQVMQFMHMPLNMSSVVKRMIKKIEDADAMPETKDFLMLAYDPSPWKSEISMTVTKHVSGGKMVAFTGTFVSKVFDGPYHYVPKWIAEMDKYLSERNQKPLKYFFHFAYCPRCAKKYGHNYCVAFAQVG